MPRITKNSRVFSFSQAPTNITMVPNSAAPARHLAAS